MKQLGLGLLPLSILTIALPARSESWTEQPQLREQAAVSADELATMTVTAIEAETLPPLTGSDRVAQAAPAIAVTAVQLLETAEGLTVIVLQ
ncbi:MAG: hypothetical protein F6K04_22625 [Leptolyngbya sp. SIO4C5]|nr:hypothetical protein [Leptolyngbya sp. SIO4C5]